MVKTRTTRTPGPSRNPRQTKQSRASANANYCLELGFDVSNCCSGCQFFDSIIPPERLYMMKQLLSRRHKTHTSEKYRCAKPWEIDFDSAQTSQLHMVEKQLEQLKVGPRSIFIDTPSTDSNNAEENVPAATNSNTASPKGAYDTADTATSSSASESDAEDSEPATTASTTATATKPPAFNVELVSHTICCQGLEFLIENVPKTHAIVPKAHLKRLQNKERKLIELEKQFKRKRFADVAMSTKTTIAMALVSVPALALKAAQYFIPSIVGAFLLESGILNYKAFNLHNPFHQNSISDL